MSHITYDLIGNATEITKVKTIRPDECFYLFLGSTI